MKLFAIKLPLIKENDDLLNIIIDNIKKTKASLSEGDIVVIAE
jgi:F420-0:gamma-glutamyl ligase